MQSHAWGIPDSAFFDGVLIACVAHLAAVVILRLLSAHPLRRRREPDLAVDAYELAALTDGGIGALTTAATALHESGHIAVKDSGTIIALTAPDNDCAPIERALFATIARTPDLDAYNLPAALTRGRAMAQIAGGLHEKGLMPAPWVAVGLRWLSWSAWGYGVVTFTRMFAVGSETEGPINSATVNALCLSWLLPAAVSLAGGRRSMPITRLGRCVLARHRERHGHLQDGHVASDDLALAVALFGSEPLRNAQPQLAHAWGIISTEEAALQRALL